MNTVVAPIVKLHFNSFSIIITICFPSQAGDWRPGFGGEGWGLLLDFFFLCSVYFFGLFFAGLAVWLPSHHDFTSTRFRPSVIFFDTLSTPSCAQEAFPRFSYSSSARPLTSAARVDTKSCNKFWVREKTEKKKTAEEITNHPPGA